MFLSGEATSAGNDPWSKPWKHWDPPGADKRGTGATVVERAGGVCALWAVGIGAAAAGSSASGGLASRVVAALHPEDREGVAPLCCLFDEEPSSSRHAWPGIAVV
jgi:hypothetical protein